MFSLENLCVSLSPKWVTMRFFTEGWDIFLKEEYFTLTVLTFIGKFLKCKVIIINL